MAISARTYETETRLLRSRFTVSGCATLQLRGGRPRKSNSTSLTTIWPISVKEFGLEDRILRRLEESKTVESVVELLHVAVSANRD